jgi:hypothetical protein
MYQIQRIWNSHVLSSNAHLVRSPWYNRERSIQSDILYHVETYMMHTLSLVSCFFALNQTKSIIHLSSLFHRSAPTLVDFPQDSVPQCQ